MARASLYYLAMGRYYDPDVFVLEGNSKHTHLIGDSTTIPQGLWVIQLGYYDVS